MNTLTLVATTLAAVSLAGCMNPTPNFDAHFGETVNMAVAQQTIHPGAAKNRNPVYGVDGVTARNALQQYQNTSKEPPPSTNIFNIGIGGSK